MLWSGLFIIGGLGLLGLRRKDKHFHH